jgi:hypothetical protein
MTYVVVFDVNETLLDLRALDPDVIGTDLVAVADQIRARRA